MSESVPNYKNGYWYTVRHKWEHGLEIFIGVLFLSGIEIYRTTAVSEAGARTQINQHYARMIYGK